MATTSANFQPESRPLGGRYRLIQSLGSGGFGQTFSAQDLHLPGHPLCVVKQLKPQITSVDELQVARRLFDTEAQTLAKLGAHPQIPALLAHFEEDQEFYLAQEFIQGHSLADELGSPWTEAQVIAFLGDLLGVLAFVHSHGVIHRDIKPSNLIRRASDRRIVLIDFGAVKQVSNQATALRSGLSHTISIGTAGYMPSEQVAGRPQFSSDIYAVGVLGIQALTGYPPTEIHPDPHSGELEWRRYAPNAHPALLEVLDAMVRYDFRTRYATAAEALAALKGLPPALSRYVPAAIAPPSYGPPITQAAPTVAVGRRREQTRLTAAPPAPAQRRETRREKSSPALWLPLVAGASVAIAALVGWQVWRSASTADPDVPSVAAIPTDAPTASAEPQSEVATTPPGDVAEPADVEPAEPADPPEPVATAPDNSPEPSPEPPSEPSSEPPEPSSELTPAAAQATIATLYSAVSNQNWDRARSQFGGSLAQQFDPGFFSQFDRVSVENLRVTGQTADTLNLVGENTYVYPDGSTQREERSFTVQMSDGQPRIVGSDFRSVLKAR